MWSHVDDIFYVVKCCIGIHIMMVQYHVENGDDESENFYEYVEDVEEQAKDD